MLIEIILALLIGVVFGTCTGLLPGIHINLIGAIIASWSISIFSSINPIYLVTFIVAMAITHTFIDFIPSVFLGCPDTDTELSILPGHQLLKKGQGYEAVVLTAYGGIAAILILILVSFPSIFLISRIYPFLKNIMAYILIGASLFLIFSEERKFSALSVFFLTGFLGLCVLNLEIKEPLLPLLSGLFGSSMLLWSIKVKTKIKKQKIKKKIKVKIIKPILGTLIASPLCGFLPGLGSGQAAIIGNTLSKTDQRGFLVLLGATNTLVMGFSFISLYSIRKTRTGAAVAIKNIVGIPETNTLVLILITSLIVGTISFLLSIKLAKFFSKKIENINYTKLSVFALIFLGIVNLVFSGIYGFIVLIISTLTGIYCISFKVRRTNMMGCLLIPTIFLYLI